MFKLCKIVFAVVLSTALVFTMMPTTAYVAFAEEGQPGETQVQEQEKKEEPAETEAKEEPTEQEKTDPPETREETQAPATEAEDSGESDSQATEGENSKETEPSGSGESTEKKAGEDATSKESESSVKATDPSATEESSTEEEEEYPAMTLTTSAGGVKVTLKAPKGSLPKGSKVKAHQVGQKYINAVENTLEAQGREMTDAVAIDVTPVDKDGRAVQPKKPVRVTFSGTGLDMEAGGSVSVYRVSDSASSVTRVSGGGSANAQTFTADHFTIYVSTGSVQDPNGDGKGPNTQTHPYVLGQGETITLRSNESHYTWASGTTSAVQVQRTSTTQATARNVNNGSDDVLVRVTHGSSQDEEYWILAKGTRTSHTVKFYLKDPGESTYTQVDSAEIDDGGTATPPSEPTSKEDTSGRTYSFDGWYEDEACQTPAVFTNITADKNYYAEYNIDQHAVTFNLKDAGETSFVKVGDDTVDDGGSAAAPPEPANKKVDGSTYEFDGWYEDEACQTPAVLTNIKDDKDYYAKYDLVGHDVTFMLKDAGQSSFATVTTDMVEDGADAEAPDEPATKTVGGKKYEFKGWYANEGCTEDADLTRITEPKTFYAKYDLMNHKVTYMLKDVGDTTFEKIKEETVQSGSDAEPPDESATKTYEGRTYTFQGWFTDEACTEQATLTNITEDKVVYARYSPKVTLTYAQNSTPDHANVPDAVTDLAGTKVTLGTAARTGHGFLSWNTEPDGGGTPYGAGTQFTLPEEDVTLYAQWGPEEKINVIYHTNYPNETDTTTTETDVIGDNPHYVVTTYMPTYTGCLFTGWSTDPNASMGTYGPKSYCPTGKQDLHLYAIWVEFDPSHLKYQSLTAKGKTVPYNGSEYSIEDVEEMDTGRDYRKYGTRGYVRVSDISGSEVYHHIYAYITPIKASGTDAGTYDTPLVALLYTHNDTTDQFDKLTENDQGIPIDNYTLKITPAQFTVSTDSDTKAYDGTALTAGGKVTFNGQDYPFTHEGTEIELVNGEKVFIKTTGTQTEVGQSSNGYEIDWDKSTADKDNYTVNEETIGTLKVLGNTVNYVGNTTDSSLANVPEGTNTAGMAYEISDQVPTRTNYQFTKWNTKSGGTGDDYEPGDTYQFSGVPQTVTFYAQWEGKPHTVTYDATGGKVKGQDTYMEDHKYNDKIQITDAATDKEHYNFVEWNTKKDGTGDSYDPGDEYTVTGDVTFYAIWKIQKHTLTYDANGGKIHDQDTYDEIHDYGETVPIVEAPVREHFKFLGWQEVDGQTYQPGDDYTVEGDTTFIAQWEEIPIKITYDPNGGIFRDSTDPTVIEQSAFDPVIIAEAATREHFKFVEWNTKPDGTGDPYDPEAVTEFSEDVTFYAIWEQIKCTVTYVPNGGKFRGSEDPTFIEYNEGETIAIAEAPTRQGYTFVGWFWQGEEYQPGDEVVVSDDMIFSAHWKKNESPVDPVDPVKPDKPDTPDKPDPVAPDEPDQPDEPDTPDKEKKAEEEEESTETGDSFLLGIGMLLLLTSAGTGLSLWRRRRAQ